MKAAGHSPSIRLFEAAACATPIISDAWDGLDELFAPGSEILIARTPGDVAGYLQDVPEADRLALGRAARERIMANHTAASPPNAAATPPANARRPPWRPEKAVFPRVCCGGKEKERRPRSVHPRSGVSRILRMISDVLSSPSRSMSATLPPYDCTTSAPTTVAMV